MSKKQYSRNLRAILDAAERRIDKGAGIGHEEFWHKVESAAPSAKKKHGRKNRSKPGS